MEIFTVSQWIVLFMLFALFDLLYSNMKISGEVEKLKKERKVIYRKGYEKGFEEGSRYKNED